MPTLLASENLFQWYRNFFPESNVVENPDKLPGEYAKLCKKYLMISFKTKLGYVSLYKFSASQFTELCILTGETNKSERGSSLK